MKSLKHIQLNLQCTPAEAQEIISKTIDKPNKLFFLPSYINGPDFQGKIENNKFNIFVKWPRRGRPPATLQGEIIEIDSETVLVADIMKNSFDRFFKIDLKWKITLGAISTISFIILMICTVTGSIYLPIPFIAFFISMGFLIMSFGSHMGEEEAKKLEEYIYDLFSNEIAKKT